MCWKEGKLRATEGLLPDRRLRGSALPARRVPAGEDLLEEPAAHLRRSTREAFGSGKTSARWALGKRRLKARVDACDARGLPCDGGTRSSSSVQTDETPNASSAHRDVRRSDGVDGVSSSRRCSQVCAFDIRLPGSELALPGKRCLSDLSGSLYTPSLQDPPSLLANSEGARSFGEAAKEGEENEAEWSTLLRARRAVLEEALFAECLKEFGESTQVFLGEGEALLLRGELLPRGFELADSSGTELSPRGKQFSEYARFRHALLRSASEEARAACRGTPGLSTSTAQALLSERFLFDLHNHEPRLLT